MLAALTLQYEFSRDIARLDGHARNFAVLALLVALGVRLQALRPRWRYAIGALVFALITWPTVGAPVRTIGLAIGQGTQLTNARPEQQEVDTWFTGRHVLKRFTSERIAAYVRNHTAVDARVLSPSPTAMTVATGRPNAAGLVWPLHYSYTTGPEYEDAIRYLEPAAIQRLGVTYVHTTPAWMAELPARAARWLADPELFDSSSATAPTPSTACDQPSCGSTHHPRTCPSRGYGKPCLPPPRCTSHQEPNNWP